MSEKIPYGPDRIPWRETLSPWALDGDKLLVSPPSRDPIDVYAEQRDVTPKFYQVPSEGLTATQCKQAQAQTSDRTAVQTANFLGYQCNMGNNYQVLSSFLSSMLNNLGDPFVPGSFTVNSKWMERNVLDYYASLWNAKWPHDPEDPDTYWGYVLTMGSSEGNLYALWNARDYLAGKFMMTDQEKSETYLVQVQNSKDKPHAYTPIAFYSQDTHYSVIKAMTVLNVKTFYEEGTERYPDKCPLGGAWPVEVPSEGGDAGPGSVDIDALCKLVNFFAAKGYPALIVLNYGSTFKGAYDDVQTAGERLMKILNRHGLEDREIKIQDPDTGEIITRSRKGYWIHVDGALGASYMPFLRMAYQKKRTEFDRKVVPAPAFDFQLPFVCSINTSGHKFPGSPWPTGIYMTKTGLQLLPPAEAGYIGAPDTTFAGSRNGLSSVVFWTYISTHNYEAQVKKVLHCLRVSMYTEEQLKKIESEREDKLPLWVSRTPLAFSVRFRKPNDDIVYKYSLANETMLYEGETRPYTHVYCMGFTTMEKLDELFEDLRSPDAFSADQGAKQKALRLQQKQHRLPKEAKDFHHGLLLGAGNAGLLKGVKKLSAWPTIGRGFR